MSGVCLESTGLCLSLFSTCGRQTVKHTMQREMKAAIWDQICDNVNPEQPIDLFCKI